MDSKGIVIFQVRFNHFFNCASTERFISKNIVVISNDTCNSKFTTHVHVFPPVRLTSVFPAAAPRHTA